MSDSVNDTANDTIVVTGTGAAKLQVGANTTANDVLTVASSNLTTATNITTVTNTASASIDATATAGSNRPAMNLSRNMRRTASSISACVIAPCASARGSRA